MFFNAHTHRLNYNAIINSEIESFSSDEQYFYSVGLHPWFINSENFEEQLAKIRNLLFLKNVVAIGECGVDRAIDLDINLQKRIFEWHLKQAEAINKPVIVHCVRAYSDVIEILVRVNFNGVIIFHDYRGNEIQTSKLNEFNSYYSFGKSLLNPTEKLKSSFKQISENRLLLETDDSDISIEKIYISAAKIGNIPVEKLEMNVLSNIKRIYGEQVVREN